MAKEFHTERDIEDMFKRGIMSLTVTENVVLTELAYEKAKALGFQLVRNQPENPPCAPIRPYIIQNPAAQPASVATINPPMETEKDLHARIQAAVVARMGSQVDPVLLDVIIDRVMKTTGVK